MASIKPETSKGHDLGTSDTKWGTVHTGDLRTETITTTGNVIVGGTLTVTGSSIVAEVETVSATDPLISLAKDNTADTFDIGFYGKSVIEGDSKYHGIVRDASDSGKFKVFKDASGEPTTTLGAHSAATIVADLEVPSSLKVPQSSGTLADYITAVTLGTAKANIVLTVDADQDLAGIRNITATGEINAGDIKISGNSITSTGGSAPAFNDVAITGGSIDDTTIGATTPSSIVSTTFVAKGNVDLGDADTDTLTITAKIDSDVIPTGTRDLGSASDKWAEAHVVAASVETLSASGNVDLGDASSDLLTVNASIDSDLIPEADGTRSLGSSSNRWAHVHADDITDNSLTAGRVVFAGTDGKLIDDEDLSFSASTLTATNMSVTTNLSAGAFASSSVDIDGGAIDGVSIATSNITVGSGKTLDVTSGTLSTSAAQKLHILENAASNVDFGDYTVTATTFVGQISSLSSHDTDDLSEGSSNLYYTDERVDDRVSSLLVASEGLDVVYDDLNGTLTLSGEDASDVNKGVASFSSDDFSVASGAVSIKGAGVSNAQLAGSIANSKLSNSSMSIAGQTVSLGGTITPAQIASAVDGESMAITALTELDAAEAEDKTVFATLNDAKTLTLGNSTGVIAVPGKLALTGDMTDDLHLASGKKYQIDSTDVLSATTLGSGVVKSSLTSVGALASGSIASGFGAISTASNISTTQVIDLASDADVDDYSADSATGRLTLGASDDLNLYHSGSHSYVVNKVGELRLDVPASSEISLSVAGTEEAHVDAEGLDLASGNDYKVAGSSVLTATTLGSGVVKSSLTSVGALDSGSITSNFGSIDIGSSTITASVAAIDNLKLSSMYIGHTDNDDSLMFTSSSIVVGTDVDFNIAKTGGLQLGSTAVEATATELNVLKGSNSATSTDIQDADRLVLNDDGTMVQVAVTDLAAYLDDEITAMPNLASAPSLVTLGTISTGAWEATDVAVAHGGTGVSTLTQNGVLLGNATSPVSVTAAGSNGQILLGKDSGAPAFASLSTSNGLQTVAGANELALNLVLKTNGGLTEDADGLSVDLAAGAFSGQLGVTDGGTGLSSITSGHVLYASGNDQIAAAAPGSTSGVQAHADDLDTLSSMESGAASVAAQLAASELSVLDGAGSGSAAASKALVVDSSRNIDNIGNLTATKLSDGTAELTAGNLQKLTALKIGTNPSSPDGLISVGTDDDGQSTLNIQSANSKSMTLNSGNNTIHIKEADSVKIHSGKLITKAIIRDTELITTSSTNQSVTMDSDSHYILIEANHSGYTVNLAAPGNEILGREILVKNIGTETVTVQIASGSSGDLDVASGADSLSGGDLLRLVAVPSAGDFGKWCQI